MIGATEAEAHTLQGISDMTDAMADALERKDEDRFADALHESIAADRRLANSREGTWLRWWQTQGEK